MTDERPNEERPAAADDESVEQSGADQEATGPAEAAELAEKLAELNDRYLRLAAEFDNYRKRRADRDRQQRLSAFRELLESVLPAVDDLHRAVEHEARDAETFRAGLHAVIDKLDRALANLGVERLKPLGEDFDPQLHECLATDDQADAEPGTVTAVFADGYRLGDVLLRPAKVVIAQQSDEKPTHADE
jgi:molecular chaperone GrpE